MMPLALFASSSFIGLTLLTLLLYGALGVLIVLIPYILIEAAGYSGTAAGAAWCSNIPSPSTARNPRDLAAASSGVSNGI